MKRNVYNAVAGKVYYGEVTSFKKSQEKSFGIEHTDVIRVGDDLEGNNAVLMDVTNCIVDADSQPPKAGAIMCDAPI